MRKWTNWLREDLGARPCAWLRPDFVPPSPFLVVKDPLTEASRILVEPHLIDAEFCKAWMPFFCRSGHPVITFDQFLGFVGHLLPQESQLDLPRITGRICRRLLGLNSLLQVGWMVGLGMRSRLFHSLCSPVSLFCWRWLSPLAFGLRGSWMPTLPCSRRQMVIQPHLVRGPSVIFRLYIGYGPHSGLVICGSGLRGGCQGRFLVLVMVSLQSRLGSPLRWTLRRCCPVLVGIRCTLWLLMSLSLLTLLTGPFLTALWVVLVCLVGSGGRTLLITVRFVSGSNWQLVLVSRGVRIGYPTGLSFEHGFHCCSSCPLVSAFGGHTCYYAPALC